MEIKKDTVCERREEKRFDSNEALSVQPSYLGKAHTAKALNWGEGGVAFETDHELQVGAIVYIKKAICSESGEFYAPCPYSRLSSFATIRWICENKLKGTWGYSVGAQNFAYGSFY